MKSCKLFLLSLLALLATSAQAADWTPVQLSLVDPVQLFPEETSIRGVSINVLYGVNNELSGLDWGLVNRVRGMTRGAQMGAYPLGGVNITESLQGLQYAGVFGGVNVAGDVAGAQLSGVLGGVNRAEALRGFQLAGVLIGINMAKDVKGVQAASMYNQAETMAGLQVGLVNVCRTMKGVQLGLINVITTSNVPFAPILNGSF